MAVNLHTTHFRFGVNELAESTHGWHAAEDTNPAQGAIAVDAPFLLRVTVQETGGTAAGNTDQQFQCRKNAGAFQNITTTSSIVKAVTTTVFANGADLTKRLSGTGTFESSGDGGTHDGLSGGPQNDIAASGNSETECALQIVGADVVGGDVIEFRLTSPDFTITNDVVPAITVAISAITGTLTRTLGALALAAAGAVVIVGTATPTLAAASLVATGTVGSPWETNGFGFNFRATQGYVTDGAHETWVTPAITYPTNRVVDGVTLTFGWEDSVAGNGRDRNAGNDRRLAGIIFGVASQRFRIDLPATGTYRLRLAIGDAGASQADWNYLVHDTTTEKLALGPLSTLSQEFRDATGALLTNTTWAGSNASVNLTFSTTIARFLLGPADPADNTTIAHIQITQISGVSGTLSATLGGLTATSVGTVALAGTSARTLAPATSAASGTVAVAGSAVSTLGAATTSATGTVALAGTVAPTLAPATLVATGTVGAGIAGTVTQTLAPATGSASGAVALAGTAAPTLATVMSAASGTVALTGTAAPTLAQATTTSQGAVAVVGTLTRTLDAATVASTGIVAAPITGTLSATLAAVTSAATGAVAIGGSVVLTLGGGGSTPQILND